MRIDRVRAANPGPFTGPGTNTWLFDDGQGVVAVIDPGPLDHRHAERIVSTLEGRRPVAVFVTHTHTDHAPLANPIAKELQVPALGHGSGGGFEPDILLGDGEGYPVGQITVTAIYTPGHSRDHLCFRAQNVLFTGDHIIGGSSVMVEEMGPYLTSLERLRGIGLEMLYPGHGEPMEDPETVIDWYLAHRRRRHEEIQQAVREGAGDVSEIVERVYRDVDRSLHPLAAHTVRAHLGLLAEEGRIAWNRDGLVSPTSPDTR